MQQRQLRLGDILDDYCTRERRVTNHVIVAMVGQEVKLTRCSTCDAEHVFKHAKVPASRKKKESMSAAFSAVLASVQQEGGAPQPSAGARVVEPEPEPEPEAAEVEPRAEIRREAPMLEPPAVPREPPARAPLAATAKSMFGPGYTVATPPARAAAPVEPPEPSESPESHETPGETDEAAEAIEPPDAGDAPGPGGSRVHRRLIRAQLPKLEGVQPTPRPIPEFTVRDPRSMAPGQRPKGPGRPHAGGGRGAHGAHGGQAGQGGHRNPQFARDGNRQPGFPPRGPHKPGEGHRRPRPGKGPRPGKKHSR